MDGINIQALQQLLCSQKGDSDSSDDDLPKSNTAKLGPGNIGPARVPRAKNDNASGDASSDSKSIWAETEVPTDVVCDASHDPRKTPEYDIKYRQFVSPEDVYLQMGNKTPTSASCEQIVVAVKLPGEELENVDVDVTASYLDVRSKEHRLNLALPHPVDPDSSKAVWDRQSHTITVTMRLVRELDYVNF